MHVLTPIGTKINKFVLQETFDEPSNVVDKPSKVEIGIRLCTIINPGFPLATPRFLIKFLAWTKLAQAKLW